MSPTNEPEQDVVHIFLETSILIESNWDLDWPPLQAILRRVGQDVVLHTTSVTLWELLNVAKKNIEDARQRFSGFRKYVKSPTPRIEWINPDAFCQRYQTFCQFEHTGEGADLGDIVKLWLTQSPPFTAHKPPQFQDAMAFLSLHYWAKKTNAVVHVVAKDSDWANACESSEWCKLSDLGALVAKLRSPIDLDEGQMLSLTDELEVRMVDALDGVTPLVVNRPGRTYDVEVQRVEQLKISLIKADVESLGISARLRFEAFAALNISDRHYREVNCEPQIGGEIDVSLDPGYTIQDVRVIRWHFGLPELSSLDPQEIDRRWFVKGE